jgi:hypothetical protein
LGGIEVGVEKIFKKEGEEMNTISKFPENYISI